jgi:hypothetical protein
MLAMSFQLDDEEPWPDHRPHSTANVPMVIFIENTARLSPIPCNNITR